MTDSTQSKNIEYSILPEDKWKKIFFGIIIALAVIFPAISFQYGVSGDEFLHVEQAKRIASWFLSGFEDDRCINEGVKYKDEGNIFFYGQSPDTVAFILSKALPFLHIYQVRHILNALLGVFGIFLCGLLVQRLAGWRAAVLAVVIFALTPRFVGHTMNNLKDAPFAVSYIFALYAMVRYFQEQPKASRKTLVILAVSLAFSLSIRVGGLLLFIYLGFFTALFHIWEHYKSGLFNAQAQKKLIRQAKVLGVVILGGYFLGLVLWPYALVNPIKNPLAALTEFSNFSVSIRQLFEGVNIPSNELPWYYLPKYILITNPILSLSGVAMFLILLFKFREKYHPVFLFMILFAAVFPIAYILYKGSNVYGGWRQVLFVYPPLVALSAIGWNELISMLAKKQAKLAVLGVFVFLGILPLQWMVRNHPNQVVYFNYAFGGVKTAYGNYETDYYLNSLRQGALWLIEEKQDILANSDSAIIIRSDKPVLIRYLFEDLSDSIQVRYTKFHTHNFLSDDWDYGVYTSSYFDGYELRNNIWPPAETIHEVEVDGIPICVVVERQDYSGHQGVKALNSGNIQQAVQKLQSYIQFAPGCYYAYDKLAEANLRSNQVNEAVKQFGKSLAIYPDNVFALSYMQNIMASSGDAANADYYAARITEVYTKSRDRMRLLQHYGQTANQFGQAGLNGLAQKYANMYQQLLGELQAEGKIE